MYSVTLTIDTLDAETPAQAVKMFLDAAATAEPLIFMVTNPDGRVLQFSSDNLANS
jgi:hypothetical protein